MLSTSRTNRYFRTLLLCVAAFGSIALSSCEQLLLRPAPPTNNAAVFDNLWETVRDRYTFFEFKRIDWNAARQRYRQRAIDASTGGDQALFAVLAEMLNELKDDHVNIVSRFDISRSRPFFNDSANFDADILERVYLRNQDLFTGGLRNAIIERDGKKYGYMYYGSFLSPVDSATIAFVYHRFARAQVSGMILDIRNNSGGSLGNALFLAGSLSRSANKFHALTEIRKNGTGLRDYAAPHTIEITPYRGVRFFTLPVAVLTNRSSYSAASFFPAMLKNAPNFRHVKLIGDHTGGGSGLPSDFQALNGWSYRFSVSQTFILPGRVSDDEARAAAPLADHSVHRELGYNFEWGVPVDIRVAMNLADRSRDAIIERAMQYIDTGR
jgi:C-terminal processing protease CtpA/Prc